MNNISENLVEEITRIPGLNLYLNIAKFSIRKEKNITEEDLIIHAISYLIERVEILEDIVKDFESGFDES